MLLIPYHIISLAPSGTQGVLMSVCGQIVKALNQIFSCSLRHLFALFKLFLS